MITAVGAISFPAKMLPVPSHCRSGEGHSRARLLPHQALRRGSALASLYATVTLLVIGMTSEIFVPYFLQTLHGQSPLISGYIAATMAAGWTLS